MTGSVLTAALAQQRAQSQPDPAGKDKAELVSEPPKAAAKADGVTMTEDQMKALAAGAAGEGAKAERERIQGILTHEEAQGRGELAEYLAFETDMAADAAAGLLAKSPKAAAAPEAGTHPLAKIMKAEALPEPPDAGGGDDGGGGTSAKAAGGILAARNKARGLDKKGN